MRKQLGVRVMPQEALHETIEGSTAHGLVTTRARHYIDGDEGP